MLHAEVFALPSMVAPLPWQEVLTEHWGDVSGLLRHLTMRYGKLHLIFILTGDYKTFGSEQTRPHLTPSIETCLALLPSPLSA